MLKSYTASKLSMSADTKDRFSMQNESKQIDSNDLASDSIIDQTALDQMKDDWSGTLRSVSFCLLIAVVLSTGDMVFLSRPCRSLISLECFLSKHNYSVKANKEHI